MCAIEVIVAAVTVSIYSKFCVLCDAWEKAILLPDKESHALSHIQYKVGQAAQAQKELFETIRQSKGFYFYLFIYLYSCGVWCSFVTVHTAWQK